jgi:hypothetical protein
VYTCRRPSPKSSRSIACESFAKKIAFIQVTTVEVGAFVSTSGSRAV